MIAIARKNTNEPIVFYYENQLHIQALDLTENVTIKVMDITGRTVYESVDKNTLVNLSFLSKGVYIYQIVVQNKVFSNKFILE